MKIENINPRWFKFSVLFLFMCLSHESHVCFAVDTISTNQSLSGNQTIVSAGGVFELGFFRSGNSFNYYIGTWYKKVSRFTPVWIANREKPVHDIYSSVLKISDGNLVLFNESRVPIWSTNVSSGPAISSSVVAVLLDDGNLVLRDGLNSISSTILWQSFDHPTDTWLPGSKLRFNKRTNQSQRIISWRSHDDPAPGLYSLEIDPVEANHIVMVWNRSRPYWTSGAWDQQTMSFSLVPEMRMASLSNSTYNFIYFSEENESYFLYYFYNSSTTAKLFMDVSGQLQQMSWLEDMEQWMVQFSQPRQQCGVYALCGAFGSCNEIGLPFCSCLRGFHPKSETNWNLSDFSDGCERTTRLQCEEDPNFVTGKTDKFLESPNVKLPERAQAMSVGSMLECESACLEYCNCTAYAYDSDGCRIWMTELLDLQQYSGDTSDGRTIYIRLAASEFRSSSNNNGIIIGAVAGGVGLVLCLVIFAILRWRRRRMINPTVEGSLLAFGYRDLQSATKNFSEKLGGGGFGSVFKGRLPDSSIIAVKQLEGISQGEKQFRSEVSTIGTVQHVNLVRLRGFCSEGMRKLLVYDYMPNGSLDAHLFLEDNSKPLAWKTRYQIALGTARGLTYLHEKCRDCIIHCDIKPENILLDAELCPKVADFGLAKLIGREFSRVLTTMRGTRGYIAPEWISGVAITAKADVYSYGMMLFEIVSGRRNSEQNEEGKVGFFPTSVARAITQDGDVLSLLDPGLNEDAPVDEISRICKVACWCVQDDETHRPSMGQVVQILEGVLDVNVPPVPRSLLVLANNTEHIIFFTESSSSPSSQTPSNSSNASS
ncbi:G-type lectin S-receptor-like serine/threonine-protein kinase [Hibiscus syriacus]|uniref:Receptor-like serine/threonine-protein kinase n=1 Tax=Hibiscus syriacus TaxID=106335 RepID=A0A6A2WYN0_HIBSY|nr:G-type lectin S-receptor-like serine/threonine-protein kinase At2g19130 [Hibiscus syriacus]KAE8654816.1 G-type lectin S-receptor-like serine/threonine-protein kinase [Hibiscus syriacus]